MAATISFPVVGTIHEQSQPYSASSYDGPSPLPGQQWYAPVVTPYGVPSAPYGSPSTSYSASDIGVKPPKDKPNGGAPPQVVAAPSGYLPQAQSYDNPFDSLVPSVFPPGIDPSIVLRFQIAHQEGRGLIDHKGLQRTLSSYDMSFSLRISPST
ncbi:hypothetical protein U1Q18_003767 [Sarracenia purpurea var. burkii]